MSISALKVATKTYRRKFAIQVEMALTLASWRNNPFSSFIFFIVVSFISYHFQFLPVNSGYLYQLYKLKSTGSIRTLPDVIEKLVTLFYKPNTVDSGFRLKCYNYL